MVVHHDHEARLRAVERAVAELREARAAQEAQQAPQPSATAGPNGTDADADAVADEPLWALAELERRAPGAVLMVGSVEVPDEGPVRWQYARTAENLLEVDWTELAATLDALAHPARLAILQLVLTGVRTTAELLEQESVGTTGQLHHHVRQLVAAGWLVSTRRGHYTVPPPRVVPLLIVITAALR